MRSIQLYITVIVAALAACSVPDKVLLDGGDDDGVPIDAPDGGDPPDTTGPETTITAMPPASDNSTSVSFSFGSDEASATFECELDGATFAACMSPHRYTDLTSGEHRFQVRAVDTTGNPDATPAAHTWTIDTSTPDTRIDTGPTGAVASTTAAFGFSSANAGAGASFECMLDAGSFAACTTGQSFSGLSQGSHTFQVRVRNTLGTVDPTPAMRTWAVDTVAPETTIGNGPTGAVASTGATFDLSSNETGASFECNLDNAGYVACPASYVLSGLPQGARTVLVRAVDLAGNRDASPATRSWTVDTTPPDTTIVTGPPAFTTSTTASFDFSSEPMTTFQCNLDGQGFAACPDPYSLTVTEQAHTLQVRAVDALGNFDATPASRSWTVDMTNPTTTIASSPPALSASTTAAFTFTSNEAGATFECNLDSAGYAACPASHTLTGLGQGTRGILVRALDQAGNRDPTPASWSWTIDSVAPDTAIASGPPSPNRLGVTTFDFTASEGGVQYECSLDMAAFAACPDPFQTWIGNGSHNLRVRARDGANNVDATPASHTWTGDLANIAFVTGGSTGPNLGGLAGADNLCAAHAQQAGLQGTYRAWLSTSAVTAISRLGTARGWIRVDGKPFADTAANIAAGRLFHPLRITENGNESFNPVMTGTNANGTYDTTDGSCADWTSSTTGQTAGAGKSTSTTRYWTKGNTIGCGSAFYSLYCFGTDYTTTVAPPAPAGRRAFVSTAKWLPGGGLASADAVCASEANTASLTGTYKAALATSTAGALARFSSTGTRWVRVDGVALTSTTAAMFAPGTTRLDTSLNVTAGGQYVDETALFEDAYWSGPRVVGDPRNCSNWTVSSSSFEGEVGFNAETTENLVFSTSYGFPCNAPRRLLCFQE